MRNISTKIDYDKVFPEAIRHESVKTILDIRKFEIELYWKRATYFWTFIGAMFAGYIAISNIQNSTISTASNKQSQTIVIFLGAIFSLCWYLANRGGKFWQVNWEKHLNLMEDNIIGPLYKTTINKDYYKQRWYHLYTPCPYSVSKLNIIMSFIIFIVWLIIYINFEYSNIIAGSFCSFDMVFLLLLVISLCSIIEYGKSGKRRKDNKNETHINFTIRSFSNGK
jgi:hypothetical protein